MQRKERRGAKNQRARGVAPLPLTLSFSLSPPAPWDFKRFLKTVTFFNPPAALLGKMMRTLTGSPSVADALAAADGGGGPGNPRRGGVVLVTGATGGLGRRVVARLLARGEAVRAVARDASKAATLLEGLPKAPGASLEIVLADLAQAATLPPSLGARVRAVASCAAVVVRPKEGDTPDRAKYLQGIKFYDPTIADDSPEAVELNGMRHLLAAVGPHLGLEGGEGGDASAGGYAIFDAATPSPLAFGSLDDVVMGGVSESSFAVTPGAGEGGGPAGVFSGVVRYENNGGFASVRSRNADPRLDCGAYAGLALRVRGDGQRYKLILRTDPGWDSITYCASFDTAAGAWQTVALPFTSFKPVFRAKTLTGERAVPLDPARLVSVQLMLSKFEYDGALNPAIAPGPFSLPVARIAAYLPSPAPARPPVFVHVSSAGVTRPNRPGIDVDAEPPAVKMNDALGGILTYKLAGEDAVRAARFPAAIIRPTALTEEPAGMPIEVGQGDMLKGKVSREDVADLVVALLDCPAGAGLTFEVKSTVPFSQPWTGPEPGTPPTDWCGLLGGAGLVKGVTGKTVGGVYSGTRVEAEVAAEVGVQG